MNPQNANTAQMISPEAPVSESTSLKRTILVIIVIGILLLLVGVTTLFFIAKNKTSPSMVKNQSQNSAISYPTSSPTTSINPSAISLSQTGSPRNVTALPLGDKKYVTDKPKKGYIYLCRLQSGQGGGAERVGPWIKGSIWDKSVKPHISGTITWPDAFFKNVISSLHGKKIICT